MPLMISGALRAAALLTALSIAGCDRGPDAGPPPDEADRTGSALRPGYVREYVFLGSRAGEPLVVPFAFRATDTGSGIDRVLRAWLAHGTTWDGFLDERWSSAPTSGVWRVLPQGDLRIDAGGPGEVAALWYQRGERRLRLQVGSPMSSWVQGDDARFQLQHGRVTLGDEAVAGAVLEILQVDRPAGDRPAEPADWLFLAGGDSLRLVLAQLAGGRDRFGTNFGWTGGGDGDRAWESVEIEWLELRPLEEARRDIPLAWRFRIQEAGMRGEVRALGYETVIGEERAGRREIEVRYTVEGWVEVDGRRSDVLGTVRHSQG